MPYSPSERTGRSPSSVVCCFSAFYINILFNLHQTCAGPTLFEVGMLLYSAYIYPFMLTTLHLFDPFRFNSIVKPLGMKKGGGGSVAICSCFGFFYTGSLCDGFLRRVCDHKQEMLTLPWHLISPWACFYPWGPRITLSQVVYIGLLHVAWSLSHFFNFYLMRPPYPQRDRKKAT